MDMRHITADRLVDSTNGAALLELLELLERQVDVVEPFTEQPWEDVCTRADPERVRRAAELAAGRTVKQVAEETEAAMIRELGPPLNIAHNGGRRRRKALEA